MPYLGAVKTLQRVLLTGLAIVIPLVGFQETGVDKLHVGQDAFVEVELALLHGQQHDRRHQREYKDRGDANGDVQ